MKLQFPESTDSRNFDPRANTSGAKSSPGNPHQKGAPGNYSWDPKGKGTVVDNVKKTSQIMCHKCHEDGHFSASCLTRNLIIGETQDDSDPDVDNYVPDFVPSDDDCANSEDIVSFLLFLPANQIEEE